MDEPASTNRAGFIARRPAVLAAAMFIMGIFAHALFSPRPALCIAAAIVAVCLAVVLFRRPILSTIALSVSIILCGAAATQLEAFFFPRNDIALFSGADQRLARLEVHIDEPPRVLDEQYEQSRPLPPRQVTTGTVVRILTKNGWENASGQVLLQLDPPVEKLAIGQRVRALGLLQRPMPAMNPGQFDWAQYYREQRIVCSMKIPHADHLEILDSPGPSILDRARATARGALAAGFSESRSLDHALLGALVLGDHDPELRDVQEQFRRTGTSHHLAISGMHVAVLGGVVFLICRMLLLSPRKSAWAGLVAVIVYGTIALPSPPVIRSVLLCSSIALGIIWRRRTDGIQLLALSVLAMLIYHPLDLFNAGFQLSFGTVLGLMLLSPRILPKIKFLDEHDIVATAAARGQKLPVRTRFRLAMQNILAIPIMAGCIAWTVSLPLIAFHFEQLNPWAVFASLVLAPFVFLALLGGFVKIILTLICPYFAHFWAILAVGPISWMRHMVDYLATLPGSDVPLPSPPLWLVIGYYLLLCVPMVPIARPILRRMMRAAPAAAVGLVALLPFTAGFVRLGGGTLKITTLAVGAGSCQVIELPGGRTFMIDSGSNTVPDLRRKLISPFLRHEGRGHIDSLLLTHGDYDHISAAGELVSAYKISNVITSPHFSGHVSYPVKRLLGQLEQKGPAPKLLAAGDKISLGRGAQLEVLWPPRQCQMNSNNTGLVTRLTYAGKSILLPADIQQSAERALMQNPAALKSDIIVAPHHGSGEPTTPAFLKAVDAQAIISSNGKNLTQKQRLFDRQAAGTPLYRTHRTGAVTVEIDDDGAMKISTFLAAAPTLSAP